MSTFVAVPLPYAFSGGIAPTLGSGRRVDDFVPPETLQGPDDLIVTGMEMEDGAIQLYGTPLSQRAQQMLAIEYAAQARGFGDDTVSFVAHWSNVPASMFTVSVDGWAQGKTGA